jgi:hypothetical protein
MFICRLRLAQPWPQKNKMQSSCFSKVIYVQRSRNTGFSCYNVTPLPENHCSTLLTTGYKRLAEGRSKALLLALLLASGLLAFVFLTGKAFWLSGCGRLLEGKSARGKRTAEGRRFLKGNELLRRTAKESLH